MPRVPVLGGPGVQDAPLQTPMQRSSASPGLLANPQIGEAGRALAEIGAVIQEREDADKVLRAETQIKNEYLQWEGEAKQRRGQQSWGIAKEADTWWTEGSTRVAKDLSPAQRAAFDASVARMRGVSVGQFSAFEAEQRRLSLDASAKASIVSSINLAAANPGNAELHAAAKNDVVSRNAVLAQLNGWPPEVAKVQVVQDLTNFHKQVLQGLVRDNPAAAEAYFQANKGEIEGTQHAEVGAFAARATATRMGDTTADAVWQRLGPRSDRDPVSLDVMEQALRKELAGKDEAIKAGIAGLRERTAAFKDGRRERDEQLEASVNAAILNGRTAREVRSMPEFLQLSPEAGRKIIDFMENKALRTEQTAAARESRAASRDARAQTQMAREGFGAYLSYSNPDTLAGMTEAQVLNLLPVLGNELTGHLMQQKRSLANPVKLAEAKIDNEDFEHAARQMGLPIDDRATPIQKEMKGELRYRIEQLIAMEQQGGKKVLSRADKQALIRREIAQTVTVDAWGPNNPQVPVLGLTREQMADVMIPKPEERAIIIRMKQLYDRTGAPEYAPTGENVRRFYLLSKSQVADMILPPKK